ncbi:MAG: hypothetical protein ACE5EX_08120 [Phycisphaerae bacterium]
MDQRHAPSSCRSRVTRFLAGFLMLFFAGDWLIAQLRLPRVTGSTNASRKKWEMLRDRRTTPDVVVLGSSFEQFGVNPVILDERATEQLGRKITTINLAAPASSLNTEYLVVRKMLEGADRPRLAYLGITPYAVDAGQGDWLRHGLRAFADHRDLRASWSADWSTFRETLIASLFGSYFQWNDLRLMTERLVLAAKWDHDAETASNARGWLAWQGKRRPRKRRSEPATGAAVPETQVMPAAWRFDSNNINGRSVREAIAALRRHGVTVRLLELPHTSDSRVESDPRKNQPYRAFVDALIAETGVALVRPPEGLLLDRDFFDDGHLLPAGAAKLSRWLAADVVRALTNRNPT